MFFNSKRMEEENKETQESKKGIGKIVVIVVVALIIVAGIVGYMMMRPQSATAPVIPSPSESAMEKVPTTAPVEDAMMNEEGKIVVEGSSSFRFAPTKITVKKGEPVTIVFKNTGGFHDFVIDEFKVATKQIQAGQSEEVTFTPDKAGSFEFYCSVGNHRAMGMVGTLTVTE